jgi:hypothetical protein
MRFPFVSVARLVLVAEVAPESPPRLPQPRWSAVLGAPLLGLPMLAIDPRPASAAQLLALAFDSVTGRAEQSVGAFT